MTRTKRLMTDLRWTTYQLAEHIGLSQPHVSRLANGAVETPIVARALDRLERDITEGVVVATPDPHETDAIPVPDRSATPPLAGPLQPMDAAS